MSRDPAAPPPAESFAGLTEGRLVHYVLPDHSLSPGEHRPAVVVKVWRAADGAPPPNGCANLQVFTDSTNDYNHGPGQHGILWATSVIYSETPMPATWHWPERA